jgi:hypothetical protein
MPRQTSRSHQTKRLKTKPTSFNRNRTPARNTANQIHKNPAAPARLDSILSSHFAESEIFRQHPTILQPGLFALRIPRIPDPNFV